MQKLTVLVFILFCGFIKPQGNEINSIFSKCWIDKEFYECVTNNRTPFECTKWPISYLYFHNSDSVFIGSLVEGCYYNYKPINKDTLLVFQLRTNLLLDTIILESADDSIIILRGLSYTNYKLKSLGPDYNSLHSAERFINNQWIAGTYVSKNDSTVIVTFTEDGKIKGLKNYDDYHVVAQLIDTP